MVVGASVNLYFKHKAATKSWHQRIPISTENLSSLASQPANTYLEQSTKATMTSVPRNSKSREEDVTEITMQMMPQGEFIVCQ